MTKQQFAYVFSQIEAHAAQPKPPYPVSVMVISGHVFNGMAYPQNDNNIVMMHVERVFDAHRTKPPTFVWIAVENIQLMTLEPTVTPHDEPATPEGT